MAPKSLWCSWKHRVKELNWQWPSSARIKANCRGWSHPEHRYAGKHRTASRFSGLGHLGCAHPHKSTLDALILWSTEGEGQGQELQFWHTGNFCAFPKPWKSKAKLWRCQHIEFRKITTKLSSWFNSQMPSPQFQPTFRDRNLCFSKFSGLGQQHQVAGEIYEEKGETTKLDWNKSRDGPWIVQSQSQFAHPQAETQVELRQLVAVCVFLLSQAFCLEKESRGRGLTYIAVQAWQFHGKAAKTSRNLFCKVVTSAGGGLERVQEYSFAICSVGRRCLVMQIIFPFHNDIAASPYKPIKKGLIWLISTFKAGEIQCKLKNWSCLYLNSGVTFPDLIQRSVFLLFGPIFKWNLLKNCNLHLSTSTRIEYIEKLF